MCSPEKEYIAETPAFSSDILYFIMITYWFPFAISGRAQNIYKTTVLQKLE